MGTVLLWSLHEKPALKRMDGRQLSTFLESDRRSPVKSRNHEIRFSHDRFSRLLAWLG